jgi:hypothetical protein
MLSWRFALDDAENAIFVGVIHRTMGDNEGGRNVPAAQLERAAVVDPSLIWPGLHQEILAFVAFPRWDFLAAVGLVVYPRYSTNL